MADLPITKQLLTFWPVAAGAKGGTFPVGGISRKINKFSACIRSFKCFTALNIRPPEVFCDVYKKVQQSWQTSALAMHLPLARLVSMSVIFCLPPSILVVYLFSTGISEQHEWKLWVCKCKTVNTVHWFDASGSVIPLNNSILHNSYITSTVLSWATFLLLIMRGSANFRTVFSES